MQWMENKSCSSLPSNCFLFDKNVSHTESDVFEFFSTLMPHNASCFVLDWSPTFLSSSYRIIWTFEMPLHTFIGDQQPVSTLASCFGWFQMIARFLKRSPAQHFFSLVVFEKLSRSVSIKLNWFPCTSWSSLVQLTISNEAQVAVAVERDAIALRISQLSNRWLTRTTVSPDYDSSPLSCRS